MAFAFVRPVDPDLLAARPLLDLGTGDGQTRAALAPSGSVVGVDRTTTLLRPGDIAAYAHRLPFRASVFATVLASDLFHHLDDTHLPATVEEIARVLWDGGTLVAWWLEHTPDTAPDAPRFTRTYEDVAMVCRPAGLHTMPLELKVAAVNSATVGLLGQRAASR